MAGLLQLLANDLTLSHSLTSCEIDEVEITGLHGLVLHTARYSHVQNHVRPRTVLVHVGACRGTIFIAASKNSHDIVEAGNILLHKSWDLDQSILSTTNIQMRLPFIGSDCRCQEIVDLVVVDLEHSNLDIEDKWAVGFIAAFGWITILSIFRSLLRSHMQQIEDLLDGSMGDTVLISLLHTIHGVRLSAAGLTVCKDTTIEAIDHTERKWLDILEYSSLRTFWTPHLVKSV
mmetsp:Transcript_34546/g.101533  ORF Transcript_34546/g.101533 Transcript_34546/m.101533 type:complete len:232 (+) Transcript_34546:471-1166(+)